MDRITDIELKDACRIVENACRSLGRDCQVGFHGKGVTVAPVNWPGESGGDTLYDAIKDGQQVE